MTVKRFEMEKEYSLDINIIPVEESDGSFVHYEDYAALAEQVRLLTEQRDAVVAENVEILGVIGECKAYFISGIRNTIRPTNEGYLHMRCDTVADETPATSSAIAALRAEGVEMFAKHLHANDSDKSVCKMFALGAEEFARQLRESKGDNHE